MFLLEILYIVAHFGEFQPHCKFQPLTLFYSSMILILYLLAGALAAPKPGSKAAGENALADARLRPNVQLNRNETVWAPRPNPRVS